MLNFPSLRLEAGKWAIEEMNESMSTPKFILGII